MIAGGMELTRSWSIKEWEGPYLRQKRAAVLSH